MNYTQLSSENIVRDFCSRGIVVIAPGDLGISEEIHRTILEREKQLHHDRLPINAESVPEILQVLASKGVNATCNDILGDGWAVVPYTHNAPFLSGAFDQHWHKDDNGPYNSRKVRHHHAVQAELLYYPQQVRLDMGPTAIVPFSQYWTFNHETNLENFAGADHLDFDYQSSGMERIPVSGPSAKYSQESIRKRATDHDCRMRESVENLKWPLVHPDEIAPLDAGTVVIYSHNLLHRGNHRRDHWKQWKVNPRFMWRFWLYRTTEPKGQVKVNGAKKDKTTNKLTSSEQSRDVPKLVKEVWEYHRRWIQCGNQSTECTFPSTEKSSVRTQIAKLKQLLFKTGVENEPQRIGAAYALARMVSNQIALETLETALHSGQEEFRRAATYGLASAGEQVTTVTISATKSSCKWVRKAGAFCLGESGSDSRPEVVNALSDLLRLDSSVHVRSVAASALGCVGRRTIGRELTDIQIETFADVLLGALNIECNRLSMDKAQNRSIKMVRPTEECDICEGIGITYGFDRFLPVRSAVRENILWSLVILCSSGTTPLGNKVNSVVGALLDVATNDKNIFCVGFALDALTRLLTHPSSIFDNRDDFQAEMSRVLSQLPLKPWESLMRGGMPVSEPRIDLKPHVNARESNPLSVETVSRLMKQVFNHRS